MAAVVLTDLPDETYRALERMALDHGRSLEGEIRDILDAATAPRTAQNIGSALAALGKVFGGIELEIRREASSARVANFD